MLRFPLPNHLTISYIVHVLQPLPTMFDTPSPFVTLISNDGFEFIVSRDAACVAGTIKKMLDPTSKPLTPPFVSCQNTYSYPTESGLILTTSTGKFSEAMTGRCNFSTIK